MDEREFRAELAQAGGPDPTLIEWEANRINAQHAHDFTARGLVLAGRFTISTADETRTFEPGDVYVLTAGIPHTETVGAEGVRLLSARLYAADGAQGARQ